MMFHMTRCTKISLLLFLSSFIAKSKAFFFYPAFHQPILNAAHFRQYYEHLIKPSYTWVFHKPYHIKDVNPSPKAITVEVTKMITVNPICIIIEDGTLPCVTPNYGNNEENYEPRREELEVADVIHSSIVEEKDEGNGSTNNRPTPMFEFMKHFVKHMHNHMQQNFLGMHTSSETRDVISTSPIREEEGAQTVKTIWRTVTEKVTKTDVTATLVISNCIPNNIPLETCVNSYNNEESFHDEDSLDYDIDIRIGPDTRD